MRSISRMFLQRDSHFHRFSTSSPGDGMGSSPRGWWNDGMAGTGFSRKFLNIYIYIYTYIYISLCWKKSLPIFLPILQKLKILPDFCRLTLRGLSPRPLVFFCVCVCFFFWFAQGSKFFVFSFSTKTFIKLECFLAPKTIILEHGPNNWPNWDQNEFRLATRRNWGRTWRRDEGLGADDSFAMALLKSHHVRHERRSEQDGL